MRSKASRQNNFRGKPGNFGFSAALQSISKIAVTRQGQTFGDGGTQSHGSDLQMAGPPNVIDDQR
jgi:hypothetical protein